MSADSGPRRVPASRYWLFLGVAALGCGIDLATKSWIFAWIGMPYDPRRGDVWLHSKINGVVDWPVLTVADSMLVCGALILFWQVWSPQHSTAAGQQSVDEPAKQIPSAAGND